jgi:uncharacterized protein (TIGR00255 family)
LDNRNVTVELRSVNSRFLEVHARFPREYAGLEGLAKVRIKEAIRRGRVDVSLAIECPSEDILNIDAKLVGNYLRAFRQLRETFNIAGELSISDLLQLPGVLDVEGRLEAPAMESLEPVFEAALNEAIDALQLFRSAEGRTLREEMRCHLEFMRQLLEEICGHSEKLLTYYQQRLSSRIQELLPIGAVDPDRIVMEAAVYAAKSEIREEIVRLRSHLEQSFKLLDSKDEAGKRMDFLLQEMNREANTILSKAGPVEIAQLGVQIKAEIEKVKEQVQNIE